ncbi:MAG: hypothetical protein E7291_03200 [Lachnospiraceae bacterium]|nr:hypothetical protein [Lachnospiraceae bacterium]
MVKKITFHDRLYLGESITEMKLDKLKKKLEKKPLLANVYLIVPAINPHDQLEILDAKQLIQTFYRETVFLVIGIAANYEEALLLVEQIVQECLEERGDCRLREYLSC